MNVAEFLHKSARTHARRPALQQGSSVIRYSELDDWVGQVAHGFLRLGLRRGDRIGIWSLNRPELAVALFAAFRAGLVAVPINARLHHTEVAYILQNSGAAALVFDSHLTSPDAGWPEELSRTLRWIPVAHLPAAETALNVVQVRPGQSAWLFYTSGTTGRPKGAILTHGNLVAMTMNCLADLHSFQPEDIVLHAAPLTHGSGLYLLPPLARGSLNVLTQPGPFDPAVIFDLVRAQQVTAIAFLAPTQIVAMMNHPAAGDADLSSLRAVIYGGGPMHVQHIKRALDRWGPIFIQLYGQGETPMTGTYLRREDHLGGGEDQDRRLASVGIPRTDVQLQIHDPDDRPLQPGEVGEVVIRSATVMKGYWRNAEATAAALRNGWLHTGDLGYEDPDGYMHLVERAKDLIITGGNNVYAREVEDVILTHPEVIEVAVVGIPDDYWGEVVHAVLVARTPLAVTAADIIEHCRARLASYKKPKAVHFIAELPKNAYGKVLKRDLREGLMNGPKPSLISGGEQA